MRSALLCVFIALIVIPEHNCESTEEDDFSPTPIPLNNWQSKRQDGAGTLQEITKSDALSSVAAVPAHYWEDALRHSVYLTLVRDKIDQLIAKPDSKDEHASNDFDDHEMWEKIKTAPFDRRKAENPEWLGDVTMVARGRLLEESDGFRFTEDEKRQKCNDEKCKEGVKAYWYVKRVRQRDDEAMSGKYHYELTFSVTSHTSPKKKPYENAVRTYTVRETTPTVTKRVHETINNRPQRAIWVHKNIAPSNYHKNQHYDQGLDRIFSSLFSDEDTYDEPSPRYKQQNHFSPQIYPQHSKTGHVTQSDHHHHHHNKMMPYPYNPPSYKYSRPSYQTSLFTNVPPYADFDSGVNNAHPSSLSDHRYLSSNLVKTTRPAVLPTPVMTPLLPTLPSLKNGTFDLKFNITYVVSKEPELMSGYKSHNKPRPAPMKISYFPDHVRPPVYNAPPGVFVTMDKKPFKPMPPLKLTHSSKPLKPKPIDFRPSPPVLFSNPDSSFDSSFRPITIDYGENNTTTEKGVIKENNKSRRIVPNVRKSTKKQDKVKSLSTSTSSPDIITVSDASVEDTDAMDWANVLGAFTKTTPLVTTKKVKKFNVTESTPSTTVTTESTTTTEVKKINDETSSTSTTSTTTTTTEKPKKRTRPPPKFTKIDKNRKRKPATSRNTSTTNAPEKITRTRTTQDLTAQASSAVVNEKSGWKPKNKTTSTTPMTTSVSTTASSLESTMSTTGQTTTIHTTTVSQKTTLKPSSTSPSTASTIQNEIEPSTIQPRNKNRYRQSTLMYKGTSVKHDRWNAISSEKNKTIVSNKFPRRKVSNFQGYAPSTQKSNDIELEKKAEQDHSTSTIITTLIVNKNINEIENKIATTEATSDYSEEKDDENSQESTTDLNQTDDSEEFEDENNPTETSEEQESQDHSEYIFNSTSNPNENLIENLEDNVITTEQTIITSLFPTVKNKTKCKKKKNQQSLATKLSSSNDMKVEMRTTISTSEKTTTVDFLDELLDSLDETNKPRNDSTQHINSYDRQINEEDSTDIEEFLSSLETNNRNSEEDIAYDVELSDEFSPFNNDDDNRGSRNANDNYSDYQDRYSILELMAME